MVKHDNTAWDKLDTMLVLTSTSESYLRNMI